MNQEKKETLETHLFVGSMCGEVMCTEDNIDTMNQLQNDKAKAYLKKHPNAIVGRFNWHEDADCKFRRLKDVMPLLNFSYDFALPDFDDWAFEYVRTWNENLTLAQKSPEYVEQFWDYIDTENGIHFFWI